MMTFENPEVWALIATVAVNAIGVGFFVGTFMSKQRAQQQLLDKLEELVDELHGWVSEHKWVPEMVLTNRDLIMSMRFTCARRHPEAGFPANAPGEPGVHVSEDPRHE